MKKFSWLKFSKAIVYFITSIVFMSVNFYNIHESIIAPDINVEVTVRNITYFSSYFTQFFQHTWQNIWLTLLFMALGIIEMIGVRKNG